MYCVSAHGVDERMRSVRYFYYMNLLCFHSSSCMFTGVL